MLTVSVTLLHGVIRATSADDLSLAGGVDPGDWPPSPARLVAALVAADGTRGRCRVTDGSELSLFENAQPPRIYASPRSEVLQSALRGRFVVTNDHKEGTVQDYPGRKAALIRPGTRLCPRSAHVTYVWGDIEPQAPELQALASRAARIAYLGCADSPARVSVSTSFDPGSAPGPLWEPDPSGDCDVPVPFPGYIEVLDRAFDQWTAGAGRRSWFRSERAPYRSPEAPVAPGREPEWPVVIWLRFEDSLPGRSVLRVTETLKAAILDLYQRYVVGPGAEVPPVLHGHGFDRSQAYQLAQWIALPDTGRRYARGRLHGAGIMLPRGVDGSVVEGVRHAAWRLRELAVPGLPAVPVKLYGGETRPWAANPDRWCGPRAGTRRWISALPVVAERRRRHGATQADVAEWCVHAGFPEPEWSRLSPAPILPGVPSLRPGEVFRERDGVRRPYSYVEVLFAEPITGPVVLGRARQFGLGLMAPIHPDAPSG